VRELLLDFITSLDGYASEEGWLGWWGLEGPEYLAWPEEQPEVTYLMGANTYRLMSGFAAGEMPEGTDEFSADDEASVGGLAGVSNVLFCSSLGDPLTWANSTLVRDDAVDAVDAVRAKRTPALRPVTSLIVQALAPDHGLRAAPGSIAPARGRSPRAAMGRTRQRT
jgi:dihydrofolate reductase